MKMNDFFFSKRHQICPQERKRTPKELRASRSVTTAKIHTQRPGRAKTVAREREPLRLRRLHRTVCFARLLRTSRKTGRTCTLRNGLGYNAAATRQPPRGAGKAREISTENRDKSRTNREIFIQNREQIAKLRTAHDCSRIA